MIHRPSRPRVVFWDTLPSPYGVEQFNALADRANLDLSVWFCRRIEPDRAWEVNEADWRFAGEVIADPTRSLADASRFLQRCRRIRPDLVISPYGERAFVAGHVLCSAVGIRTVLLVQRTFDAWVQRRWWKNLIKAGLFRSAHAAYVHGPDGRQYARQYGFPEDRIFTVRQTTNVERFRQGLSADERRRLRARLGVSGCVFLYVGRLWRGKGVLHLIDAFRRVRSVNPGVSLLFLGGGVDERDAWRAAEDLGNVVFHPFVPAAELSAYYAAADVFVFPTLGDPHGQVIEEAHAAGLPIVTTEAVGEVRQRVADGVSGFVVPAANAAALARGMLTLAADPDLRVSMGRQGAERANAWGHDTYASEMERLVASSLSLPPRRSLSARGVSGLGRLAAYVASRAPAVS